MPAALHGAGPNGVMPPWCRFIHPFGCAPFVAAGLDGNTSEEVNFVGIFTSEAFSMRFCGLQHQRELSVQVPLPVGKVQVATNDVIVAASGPAQETANTFLAWISTFQLAGEVPNGTVLALQDSVSINASEARVTCNASVTNDDTVALCWQTTPSG